LCGAAGAAPDYLEKAVETLKRKLVKEAEAHRADTARIMKENMTLITCAPQRRGCRQPPYP